MQLPTVENKLSEFDARLSRVEGIIEQLDKRMSSIESRLSSIETGQRWIIGIQFTTLITLGSLILFKLG